MTKQQAYLEALGITAWERRQDYFAEETITPAGETPVSAEQVSPNGLTTDPGPETVVVDPTPSSDSDVVWNLGAGDSACVLLVEDADQAALDIANDLSRALGDTPVWGWPDPGADGDPLGSLATDRLLTSIIIFGPALANLTFSGPAPGNLSQARITVLPDMKTLQASAEARRSCWASLITAGVVRSL